MGFCAGDESPAESGDKSPHSKTRGLAAADGVLDLCESGRAQSFRQAAHDLAGHAGAFINQAGLNLHEAGAGEQFLPGIAGIANSADADDGQLALRLPP